MRKPASRKVCAAMDSLRWYYRHVGGGGGDQDALVRLYDGFLAARDERGQARCHEARPDDAILDRLTQSSDHELLEFGYVWRVFPS